MLPAMKTTERFHGGILVIVMRKRLKRLRRRFPKRSQEISELLTMQIDSKDENWHNGEEEDICLEIKSPKNTSNP